MSDTIYDVSKIIIWGWLNPVLLTLVAIGAFQNFKKPYLTAQNVVNIIVGAVFGLVALLFSWGALTKLNDAKTAMSSGDFKEVRGIVYNSKYPNPIRDRKGYFEVKGVVFPYTYFGAFGGFTNSCFLGCDINDGDQVIVYHKNRQLLKIMKVQQ